MFDAEASALRKDTVERGDVAGYMALSRQRNDRVKTRLMVSGGIAAASITATAVAEWVYPVAPWAVLFVALVLLGWNGRRADRPLIDSAIISAPGARKLTADMVDRAGIAAKLCTDADPITFVAPGVHRDGEGFRAVFDLPYGSKAATAIKRIEDIAAGLDVDEVRVFVDRVRGDTGSARRCSMWVADRDPYAVKPPVTPLVGMGSVDFWEGFPFGIDARRRPINLALVWSSLLVGAIPRMGKTFAARLPVVDPGPVP